MIGKQFGHAQKSQHLEQPGLHPRVHRVRGFVGLVQVLCEVCAVLLQGSDPAVGQFIEQGVFRVRRDGHIAPGTVQPVQ